MQHHRILSRDEWFPARRRRLGDHPAARSVERERRRNGPGADFDLTDWARRPDDYQTERKGRASAA
jgi:hypothetical protein